MKIELAHDILAKRIYDISSTEDKMRMKIHDLLKDRLALYEEKQILLTKEDLNYIYPFLKVVELQPKEFDLVKKSERSIAQKKRKLYMLIAGVIILLLAFNFITWLANQQNKELLQEEEEHVQQLQIEDSLRTLAEMRADTLYQQLLKINPEFAQDLLKSFDTLKIAKKNIEKQRNIAQSSTLSSLAATALEQQDKNYAFQLAAKAWELNHDNQLACELLYRISDDAFYASNNNTSREKMTIEEHDQYIERLINKERSEHGRGELDDQTMHAIFNQHNTIVLEKEKGIRDKIERYYNKAQDKAEELYKETESSLRK